MDLLDPKSWLVISFGQVSADTDLAQAHPDVSVCIDVQWT